jgi:hypothetical protein
VKLAGFGALEWAGDDVAASSVFINVVGGCRVLVTCTM